MESREAVLGQWIAETAKLYPRNATALLTENPDPFRNPVGHTLRSCLSRLLEAIFGGMNDVVIESELGSIIRIHAVQGMGSDEAVQFLSPLKAILRQAQWGFGAEVLETRLDHVKLLASVKYQQCRNQIVQLRTLEQTRALHRHARRGRRA